MSKITILGAGTWGVALSRVLFSQGNQVAVWSPMEAEVEQLKTERKQKNLPGMVIPQGISFDSDISAVIKDAEFILIVVPSVFVRSTVERIKDYVKDEQIIVCATKGIEEGTFCFMSEVISSIIPNNKVVALSGPTHAEEVALDMPTTIVSACEDYDTAQRVRELFVGSCIRAYTNPDIIGVELCASVKNIIALAAGISNGLGYGDNAKAAIITRGLAEIKRLGISMGCVEQTFSGLTGVGDLIVTATSVHSRNNRCGNLIGKGYTPQEAVKEVGMVVEGINSLKPVVELAKRKGVEMPITNGVYDIVFNGVSPKEVFNRLMARDTKREFEKNDLEIIYQNQIINNKRGDGMKRVITYGTFDLLHYGHINLLKRAKALGDYLVVCLSTDEFNWNEKKKKCYFTYEQRKMLLESLRFVDLVIPETNWNQKKTDMHEYHIDTFVIGDDWKGKFDFLKEEGVEVVYLPRTPEISSSKMKMDLNGSGKGEESKITHDDIDTNPKN